MLDREITCSPGLQGTSAWKWRVLHTPSINMSCSKECHCKGQGDSKSLNDLGNLTEDVWGSDEENISSYADLQRAHVNQGYLDGITRAQESGLQAGFDKGFPDGAALGLSVGRILAQLHDEQEFPDAKRALNITQVLDKKHFDEQLDLQPSKHMVIAEWEDIVKSKSSQ